MCCCAGNDSRINGKPLSFSSLSCNSMLTLTLCTLVLLFYNGFPFVCWVSYSHTMILSGLFCIAITTISVGEQSYYTVIYDVHVMVWPVAGIDQTPASMASMASLATTRPLMSLQKCVSLCLAMSRCLFSPLTPSQWPSHTSYIERLVWHFRT